MWTHWTVETACRLDISLIILETESYAYQKYCSFIYIFRNILDFVWD